jgi:pyruvate,water dikinase
MTIKAWLTDTAPSARFPVFTRLNAAEVMPDPITPLAASMCWVPHVLPGWAAGYVEDLCFTPEELTDESAVAGLFFGYLYINQSAVRVLGIRKGLTWQAIDATFFDSPGAPPHIPRPEDENPVLAAKSPARAAWALSTSSFPDLEEDRSLAERARMERPDLAALSDRALIARARSMMPYERLAWRGEQAAASNAAVGPTVAASLLPPDKAHLLVPCIGQAGDVDSAQPVYALWSLSRMVRTDGALGALFDQGAEAVAARLPAAQGPFWTEFARFLADFGCRGPSEWDLGGPSWESKPELALSLIDRLRFRSDRESPAARQAAHAAATEAAMAEAVAGMDAATEAAFRGAVSSARRFGAWRERGKTNCIKFIHEARMALVELGQRLAARGIISDGTHVFMALDAELDALALSNGQMRDLLEQRAKGWRALAELEVPMFIDGSRPLPALDGLRRRGAAPVGRATRGAVLRGAAASQGVVEGIARVVSGIDAIDAFQPGEVLVARQMDPSWTPLFMAAGAVIVDTGSLDSHAMIVARELGIPCVAGLPGATSMIATGTRVRVDGAKGTVEILE